jgi:aryl-phospho-beta-D-glucosidase BglC (GH1 family)
MIPMKKTILFACLLLGLASAGAARAQQAPSAWERAKHLQHGINASIWFAQSPNNYSVERLRTFTTADDIALMQRLGLDHVRLSIDAEPLVTSFQQRDGEAPFLRELDRVVNEILAHKLAVIIDIHPESRYKATLRNGDDGVQRFAMLWQSLAKHYASEDPELVFFEIMNEAEQDDPYRWQGIQAFVADQIRQVAPKNTIIASGAHWDGLEDLLHLQPLALDDVIYTFHDYEPFPFTHQGATWTSAEVQMLHGVPYPSSPEAVQSVLDQEPTLAGKFFVEQYGLGNWGPERVDATVNFADLWSKQYHAPVYCGEFGVHIPVADPKMRAQWIHDMRIALERHHIGWAMWDYQTNFGLVSKKGGKAVPDPLLVDALGLNKQAQ